MIKMVIIFLDFIIIKLNNYRLFYKIELCKQNIEQLCNIKEMYGEYNKKMFI